MKFLISNDSEKLREAIEGQPSATIEARFGQDVVQGSLLTMGVYGPDGKPACCYANGCVDGVEVVGLTHLDLNVLAGCMALLGVKPEAPSFWQLVEFLERFGSHMLGQSGASEDDIKRLYACWALLKDVPSQDESVVDITSFVEHAVRVAAEGIVPYERYSLSWLVAGSRMRRKLGTINYQTFFEIDRRLIVRVGTREAQRELSSVGDYFVAPNGEIAQAVLFFNTEHGRITLSMAMCYPSDLIVEIGERLWGEELQLNADGSVTSPKSDERLDLSDLNDAVDTLHGVLSEFGD